MSVVAVAVVGTGLVTASMQDKAASKAAKSQNAANSAALDQEKELYLLGLENSNAQQTAALKSSNAQHSASLSLQRQIAMMSIGEQKRQFDMVRETLAPYITAGNKALKGLKPYQKAGLAALSGQRDLIGLNGTDAQKAAIAGLENSPEMAAYIQQGENALLQNAAATGGIRGGNTQGALAQFRPSMLAGMINQQYERLGGLTGLGANTTGMVYQTGASSAAGQANAGMQLAAGIGNTLSNYASGAQSAYNTMGNQQQAAYANAGAQQMALNGQLGNAYQSYYNNQGSINAGRALAQGQAWSGALGTIGQVAMLKGMKVF